MDIFSITVVKLKHDSQTIYLAIVPFVSNIRCVCLLTHRLALIAFTPPTFLRSYISFKYSRVDNNNIKVILDERKIRFLLYSLWIIFEQRLFRIFACLQVTVRNHRTVVLIFMPSRTITYCVVAYWNIFVLLIIQSNSIKFRFIS